MSRDCPARSPRWNRRWRRLVPTSDRSSRRVCEQLEGERANQQTSLDSSRRLQPLIHRLLPTDPFMTVVVVIVVLMVSTFIKHVFMLINTMLIARVSNDIARGTRLRIFERAMHMDRAGFAKYGTSGFTTQITATTDMLANGIMEVYGGAIREPLKILACLAGRLLHFLAAAGLVADRRAAGHVPDRVAQQTDQVGVAPGVGAGAEFPARDAGGLRQHSNGAGLRDGEDGAAAVRAHDAGLAATVAEIGVLQCADAARDGTAGDRHGRARRSSSAPTSC